MNKQWWHDKVAYQIYPKSFCDSNGDGIGDINGIISKLDYLQDLGIEIIWISPMYQSPFKDQGYDISDYYSVDPIFGNLADMDRLIAEVKKRNMYVLLDLVINHCSNEHEWFQQAVADPDGEYGKYFYIREGEGENPPNNWRSYFGGSAWEKISNTNKYYLHLFAKEQPDLNFENLIVREKIYQMMNWWLERGISGYRIDAIINIKKDLSFKSYKPDRADGLASPTIMIENAVGVLDILKDINENTFAKHKALTVAELFNYDNSELAGFIGKEGVFSTIFDFATDAIGGSEKGWYARSLPTANQYRDKLFASQKCSEKVGLLCNIIENHDEPRGVSRYLQEINSESKKMLATINFMAKGMPFLFRGQEIGMENNVFDSIEDIDDISSIDEYNNGIQAGYSQQEALKIVEKYSRDNSRSPMHWNDNKNAGFTTGDPRIKLNKFYKEINVENQQNDEKSVLTYYKKLINLRKDQMYKEVIVYGEFIPTFEALDNMIAFYRKGKEKTLLVVCNFQNAERIIKLKDIVENIMLNNTDEINICENILTLAPYQAIIFDVTVNE